MNKKELEKENRELKVQLAAAQELLKKPREVFISSNYDVTYGDQAIREER